MKKKIYFVFLLVFSIGLVLAATPRLYFPSSSTSSVVNITDLSDVDTLTYTDSHVLTWNATSQLFDLQADDTGAGGGGTPGGADTQIQFNDNGNFNGTVNMTYNETYSYVSFFNNQFHTTGSNNFFFGEDSGNLTTGSTHNIGIGKRTLKKINTGGQYNVALGNEALRRVTTGDYNVGIGSGAGDQITTGRHNFCFGQGACSRVTDGEYNVMIGSLTGDDITTQDANLFIGYRAGKEFTSANNVFIGRDTGLGSSSSSTATLSVGVGNIALNDLTDASYPTAIGYASFQKLTTGNYNTGIGAYTGEDITTQVANVFVGGLSGRENKGNYNVGLGYNTLSGSHNTNTADRSLAIGMEAMKEPLDSDDNIAIGLYALKNVKDADRCVAVGTNAGEYINASDNFFFGYKAGKGVSAGSNGEDNLGLGNYVMTDFTSGSENTCIGQTSCQALTSGSGNVVIGRDAGDYLTTEDNNLIIDNSNNQTPLIYGKFDDDYANINGKLGINASFGNFNPSFPLEVHGSGADTVSIWASGNVSATGYITRTSVYNKEDGPALDKIKDSDQLKTLGKIDHSKFYGYTTYEVPDYSKPVVVQKFANVCYDNYTEVCDIPKISCHPEPVKNEYGDYVDQEVCKELPNDCRYVVTEVCGLQLVDVTTYPHTKIEQAVSITDEIDLLRQAVYELKEKVAILEAQK